MINKIKNFCHLKRKVTPKTITKIRSVHVDTSDNSYKSNSQKVYKRKISGHIVSKIETAASVTAERMVTPMRT